MDDKTTIVTPSPMQPVPGAGWQPEIRAEAIGVIERKQLPAEAGEAVLEAAASILSRGVDPSDPRDHCTGLVVGYVQSGKTLSFTTAIALARDNGYRLVIVIAGTSKPLLNQSTDRLRKDLAVDDVDGPLRWVPYTNPTNSENYRRFISQTLDEWRDPQVPVQERATVLITVMKNHRHLANLVTLLRSLNLEGVSTLIIDDEADQASLNTLVRRGRESTTYTRLLELRAAVPCHTFLQYTATPQAPLLINIIDSLSPRFVEVLEPGDDYVGGESFFAGHHALVSVIPPQDIPSDDNPLDGPPTSLLEALRLFLIGVAAGLKQGRSKQNANRSMLVHPSQRTAKHVEYRDWIGRVFDDWHRLLTQVDAGDPDRSDFVEDLQQSYQDLAGTVPDLPSFSELMEMMPRAFIKTSIEEVNARGRPTPDIEWPRAYGWILVGGQAMDRGFTVEGLTVTYMPRGPGVGNADTVQQRARFFGYKRPYLGFCRIFLEQDALNAFEQYVHHEEEMRHELQRVTVSATPLRDWKRAFVLSPDLRPCRNSVIQYEYARGRYADQWFLIKMVDTPQEVSTENDDVLQHFEASLDLKSDETYPSDQPAQKHLVANDVPLLSVLSDLLVPYRVVDASDTQEATGLLLQLSRALESNHTETAVIYMMRPDFAGVRDIDQTGKIRSTRRLFQGPTRAGSGASKRYTYPGDKEYYDRNRVSVQIHRYDLRQQGNIVSRNKPVIAIWIPARMDLPWLVQSQPN